MKCQKCGATLLGGHLYCDVCGAEYQIVPDFEPELEISMAKSLSGLSESIQEKEKEPVPDIQEKKSLEKRRRGRWGRGILLLILILIAGIFIVSCRNSMEFLEKKAQRLAEQKDYAAAAKVYARLKEKQPDEAKWYLREGDMYLQEGQVKKAISLGTEALERGKEKEETYLFLLSMYAQEEDYEKMNELLRECGNEKIQQSYAAYLAPEPSANYSSGSYDVILEVLLEGQGEGEIYYTLDGSLPTGASQRYQEPILLGNGTHSLRAIYVNTYGVASGTLQLEFEIAEAIPLAPVIEPESGIFEEAGFIAASSEEGTQVYYTTDGTIPTRESILYQKPIPMPLGESRFSFVAYSDSGLSGEVTDREYLLNIKTGISEEEAENLLVQELIKKGLILDKNGALLDRYGVYRYFYAYPIKIEESHYYVFEERYLENEINQRTGKLYAVDVMQGECYPLLRDKDGVYSLGEIPD